MDDRRALMAAIAANADEDTPRLALADWLDEHGTAPGPRSFASKSKPRSTQSTARSGTNGLIRLTNSTSNTR